MRGKKIDVTPDHIAKLSRAIGIGATYELAAQYAGISKDTFDRWRKAMEAAAEGTPLADLRTRLRQAEAQAAVHWLAMINQAATTDWRSAAWLLARRYPEAYGSGVLKVAPVSPGGRGLVDLAAAGDRVPAEQGADCRAVGEGRGGAHVPGERGDTGAAAMRAIRLAPPVPKLWTVLCHDWLRLEPSLARSWWYALAHARWSQATAWREQFLAFDRQTGMVSRTFVTDFFVDVRVNPTKVRKVS